MPESGHEESNIRDSGEHVDEDVKLPDGVEVNDDEDEDLMHPPSEADKHAVLVEAIEEQLKVAHSLRGMDANDEDIQIMACCLTEMSACNVPKLFAKSKFKKSKEHDYGMRPGFCIDITARNGVGGSWNISNKEEREQILRLQDRECPKLVVGAYRVTKQGPRDADITKFLETLYLKQIQRGDHFVHEGCDLENVVERSDVFAVNNKSSK
jgi:hypothetical protein